MSARANPTRASLVMRLCMAGSMLPLSMLLSADPLPKSTSRADPAKIERHALDLYLGRGTPVDHAAAAREFEVAARAGRPFSQLMLAEQLFDGHGAAVDRNRAFALYRSAAEQGVASAQSAVGWMYWQGTGTKQDLSQALQWLSSAARQEDSRAYLLLSLLYANGEGVEADPVFARRLLARAAELGDAEACRRLGVALLYGPQQQRDSNYGLQVLRKGAGMQDGAAAYLLGWWYLSAAGQSRELPAAAQWMAQSAKAEHQLATLWLSEMHGKGLGVPVNPLKSRQLREQALAKASLSEKNEFAWELSVSNDGLLRNGPLAVRVMQAALTTPETRTAPYLDTLAAAHAESGNFAAAVAAQREALQVLANTAQPRQMLQGMQQRLQSYRRGQAFREVPP